MKIKNLFALSLMALATGVASAQTYTATAGTNGVTDIQSDYSMSTGDGASVSVDVPLEFELPKKLAIAVKGQGSLPADPMFDGIVNYYDTYSITSKVIGFSDSTLSSNWVGTTGGLYSNTEIVIDVDSTDFIHETDPNSVIRPRKGFRIGPKDSSAVADSTKYAYITDPSSPDTASNFPVTVNIDSSQLLEAGNQFSWFVWNYAYLGTIDPTDRAGKYISTYTVTVSSL